MSIFGNLAVAVLLLQNFFFGIVYYSQLYYLPLFFQNALQLSPIVSAALILPIPGAQMTLSILSGWYISKRGRYGEVIWAGFILWTIGVALNCLFTRKISIGVIVIALIIQGAGVGLVFQPTLVALQAHCERSQRAIIISNRNFLRSLGGAVGLAISALMLQTMLKRHMPAEFRYLADSAYSTPDFNRVSATEKSAVLDAYAEASRAVFYLMVPFMGLCLVGCSFVRDRGLQHPSSGDASNSPGASEISDVSNNLVLVMGVQKNGEDDTSLSGTENKDVNDKRFADSIEVGEK